MVSYSDAVQTFCRLAAALRSLCGAPEASERGPALALAACAEREARWWDDAALRRQALQAGSLHRVNFATWRRGRGPMGNLSYKYHCDIVLGRNQMPIGFTILKHMVSWKSGNIPRNQRLKRRGGRNWKPQKGGQFRFEIAVLCFVIRHECRKPTDETAHILVVVTRDP